MILYLIYIFGLIKTTIERSLSGNKQSMERNKPSLFPNVGYVVTLRFPFTTQGILSDNILASLLGTRVQLSHGRGDKDYKIPRKKGFIWGNIYFYI